MAGRIRTVKPEWLTDQKMARASDEARLLTVGLMLLADDQGRGVGSPEYIAAQVWTYHSDALARTSRALASLVEVGFVQLYEVDGERFFQIVNWGKHQKVDHPAKPRIPEPPPYSRENLAKPRENLAPLTSDLRPPTSTSDHGPPTTVSPEPVGTDSEPPESPVLEFPVVGKGMVSWPLLPSQLSEWGDLYPTIDVLGECRKALAWVQAKPTNRKTARGMPAFLVSWFNRATDRPRHEAGRQPTRGRIDEAAVRTLTALGLGGTP